MEAEEGGSSILEEFSSPSTFPHLILMVVISGFLYMVMNLDFYGLGDKGSLFFLSLAICYSISAIMYQTKLGRAVLGVQDDGEGIFKLIYWKKSARPLIFMVLSGIIVSFAFSIQLAEHNSKIRYFMGSLFLLMSLGQGISIVYGGIKVSNNRHLDYSRSRTSRLAAISRSSVVILAFFPLIWWYQLSTEVETGGSPYLSYEWLVQYCFLIVIGAMVYFLDRITVNSRNRDSVDGKNIDRFMMIMIASSCWHLFSTWRRSPWVQDPSSISILVEESILMGITIFLVVWSISNRGKDKGWRVFQGQSAIFWGVAFGYAYGGSVASLSSLGGSSLDLASITAVGHLITGITIILLLPRTLGLVGNVIRTEKIDSQDLPITNYNDLGENSKLATNGEGNSTELSIDPDQEDLVELLD